MQRYNPGQQVELKINSKDTVLIAAKLGDMTTIRQFVMEANACPNAAMLAFALEVYRNAYNERKTTVIEELLKIKGLGMALTDMMLQREELLLSKYRLQVIKTMEIASRVPSHTKSKL